MTVNLTDTLQAAAVHTLSQPAELRIHLASLPEGWATSSNLSLLHFNVTAQRWEPAASYRDGDDLVAAAGEFSFWSLSNDRGHDWIPTSRLEAGQTELLTGAAVFSIPLDVPEGTHTLKPQLQLAYSSTVPDALNDALVRLDAPIDNQSPATQTDWVGYGWSLGLGRITAEVGDFPSAELPVYHLELNGTREIIWCVGKRISPTDNVNYTNHDCYAPTTDNLEFRSQTDSFLRILRRQNGTNVHNIYFEVWDKAGTYYRFGYNTDAEHVRGQQHHPSAWALSLDRVMDTHGNRMEIEYFEDNYLPQDYFTSTTDDFPYTRAAYPAVIRYTFNSTTDSGSQVFGSDYQREVRFNEELWRNSSGTLVTTWTRGQTYWSTDSQPLTYRAFNPGTGGVYWGKSNRQDTYGTGYDYTTDFNTKITTGGNKNDYYYVSRYKLDSITSYLKLSSNVNEPLQPFRKYRFTYGVVTPIWTTWQERPASTVPDSGNKKLVLTKIQEYAGTGPNSQFTTPLYAGDEPSYTFTYSNSNQGNPRFNLTQIKTALGGTVDYTYQSFNLADTVDSDTPIIPRYRVLWRTLSAGGSDPSIHTTYEYGPARYYDTQDEFNEHLIGHDWVTAFEGAPLNCPGACTLDRSQHGVKHYFFTNRLDSLDGVYPYRSHSNYTSLTADHVRRWLAGREYQTEYLHGQTDGTAEGNGIKRRVANLFNLTASVMQTGDSYYLGGCGTQGHQLCNEANHDVRFVQLSRTASRRDPFQVVTSQVDIVDYAYDSYGNTTVEYECPDRSGYMGDCGIGGWKRITQRWFDPLDRARTANEPPAWQTGGYLYIVDKPIVEGVLSDQDAQQQTSDDGWAKFTYYSYDGQSAIPWDASISYPSQPIWGVAGPKSKGELTWMRRLDCLGCIGSETTADTQFGYDTWGNVTTQTTWNKFSINGTPQASATPRTVTTTYDTTLHTFVTRVTQPGGVVYEEMDWDSTAYRHQAPNWTGDANGVSGRTSFTYDDFGRLLEVQRPGDTSYTTRYEYDYDLTRTGARLMVRTTQRLDEGSAQLGDERYRVSRTFYDGLGRVVLTKNPNPNGAGDTQYTATFYDNRGLKAAETVPYAQNDTAAPNAFSREGTAQSGNIRRTRFTYDQFGALQTTTRTDDTQSVVTTVREQRLTATTDRGSDFGIGQLNPSFETPGGASSCASGWIITQGGSGCATRVADGVDQRFALRIEPSRRVEATFTYPYNTGLTPGSTLTLSWLARRSSGSGDMRPVIKVNNVTALSNEPWYSFPANSQYATGWTLFQRTFTVPGDVGDGRTLTLGFEVDASTTVNIDGLRMSWGEVRERSETLDGQGRLAKVGERKDTTAWLTTQYTYDTLDRVTSVTDPTGVVVTQYNYKDLFGRTRLYQSRVEDRDRGVWVQEFDPQANLIKRQDGDGRTVSMCYDALDRITRKYYGNVDCPSPTAADVTYTYDNATPDEFGKGRLYELITGSGTDNILRSTYDSRGRVKSELRRIGGLDYTTQYRYNSADLLTLQRYPNPESGGEWVKTSYNNAGLISGVCQVGSEDPQAACAYGNSYLDAETYDIQGRPLDVTFGNSTASVYHYDSAHQRLDRLQLKTYIPVAGLQPAADLSYQYDPFGNVTSIADAVTTANNRSYAYDSLNRLVIAGSETFTYTNQGNILTRNNITYEYAAPLPSGVAGAGSRPHAVSALKANGVTLDTFGYDNSGNMTTRNSPASQNLSYDQEGRLTRAAAGQVFQSFTYDGNGALTSRTSAVFQSTPGVFRAGT
ncbi:MAG: RHS repeat protein, partial [Anaerolineae bacterium]|nr:RHS repeat protein [Anaerolineae bacterium]